MREKKSVYICKELYDDTKIIAKNSGVRHSSLCESLLRLALKSNDSISTQIIKDGSSFGVKKSLEETENNSYDSDYDENLTENWEDD